MKIPPIKELADWLDLYKYKGLYYSRSNGDYISDDVYHNTTPQTADELREFYVWYEDAYPGEYAEVMSKAKTKEKSV